MLFTLCIAVLLATDGVLAGSDQVAGSHSTKSVLSSFIRGPIAKVVRKQYSHSTVAQQSGAASSAEPNVVLHQEVVPPVVAVLEPEVSPQPVVVPNQQQQYYSPEQPGGYYGPLPAAVQSRRYVQIVPYINTVAHVRPQIIEVDAITAPVQFLFRSASGPLLFQQVHVPQPAQQVQHTRSEEQPQLLSHEVYKPVVQELREIIQPFRRITQEIKPVVEEVHTLVAKGDRPATQAITLSEDHQPGGSQGAQVSALASSSSISTTSNASSSTTTSQVSGLKTSQVVEQKHESSVSEF